MSNFPYKNPLSSVQTVGVTTVPRSATFGTSYSVNNTGGYMEVYSLSDLIYTIPTGTTGSIEYSGNTIPIDFIKGTGDDWSPDVLTLASDNISSGRRRLGMLVYVYEEDQVYQFHVSGYTSLFTAATASTDCVVISDFGTTVKNNTVDGQNFINAWTASTIEDISGYTSDNATWRKFNTGTGTGGSGFTSVRINNVSQFTSSPDSYLNFSGINLTISSVGTNTLVLSAGTGGGGGSSNLQYFITGSTPSGVTINNGDRWFDTNTGAEVVYINDGDSSQWVRPSNGMAPLFTGNTSATCISSLYVTNVYGCSPININDLVIANSGLTTTNITATTISTTTFTGNSITLSNSASTISLNNTDQQQIRFFNGGTGAPTYNTYSAGAKIILSDNISSISSGYAIGVDLGSLWYSADLAGNGHDWYAGTKKLMSLASSSGLELVGLGGPTTTTMTISGTSVLGSKGGVGYIDFLKVVNNFSGATNPNKWFRVNSTGGLEIVNSAYSSVPLSLSDSGNLLVAGTVTANAWSAGQVIKDTILSNTEVTISTTTIGTSGSDTDFLTYSYTPISSNSYLVIHYHLAKYDATAGTGNDSWFSRIKVDGNEITFAWQTTVNGFRSGTLFPLTGRYTNSNTTAKSIVVACRRDSADDSITITNSSTSMWLRITEIAR